MEQWMCVRHLFSKQTAVDVSAGSAARSRRQQALSQAESHGIWLETRRKPMPYATSCIV